MEALLHEIWIDKEGLPGLILAGEKGEPARKLFVKEGHQLVHTFYARSLHEAMNIYYKYMDWGEWKSEYEMDKLPYEEWEKHKGKEWK